ncbi:SPOR domain-containing protein [Rhodovulum sp. BSW8]|uniref:SPOR domain-containing protein n=1 Tax=Rhodovulum sp. BSW8 TaxID=2259645 RepID=UPI000DE3C89A|nr:SPOR domain-containing protein [Rhodovulum sp. BSW8]RBO52395.1 SPOR domain-containing protein [Rhodovulum sp. BSW8]
MQGYRIARMPILLAMTGVLAGCQGGAGAGLFGSKGGADVAGPQTLPREARDAGEDVEAPEVFHAEETGLWDGRPSLGGIWIAHPDVTDPERVIIRNTATGQSVVGALFRRERESPGPRFQVSSDAAAQIGLLAGQPTELSVTALRRPPDPQPAATAQDDDAEAALTALTRRFVQVATVDSADGAKQTAARLTRAGLSAEIRAPDPGGRALWRVVSGPVKTEDDRAALIEAVRGLGFKDAYAVTR